MTAEGYVTNMFCLRAALVTGKENVTVVFCSVYRGISCLRATLATGKENVTVVFCSLYRGISCLRATYFSDRKGECHCGILQFVS